MPNPQVSPFNADVERKLEEQYATEDRDANEAGGGCVHGFVYAGVKGMCCWVWGRVAGEVGIRVTLTPNECSDGRFETQTKRW